MRRLWTALGMVALLALPGAAQTPQLVWMGTGSVNALYFPVGVALCRLVNQGRRTSGIRCAARPSEGSVGNVADLRAGRLDLALVQSDTQADAWAGRGAFAAAGPFAGLRAVMSLYPEPLTVVARADAGIAGLSDLPGKRVAIGQAGSGTRVLMDALMAAEGWTAASFAEAPDLAPADLSSALCGGRVDAFVFAVGHPALVIQEATNGCAAQLVDVAGPAVDALVAAHPEYVAATIRAGLYRGTSRAVQTFGVDATLVTRADEPDDRIYTMVQAIFGDFGTLVGLNPALADLDRRAMATQALTAPLHPGAERYYREQGWVR